MGLLSGGFLAVFLRFSYVFFVGEVNWRGVRTDQLSDPGSEDFRGGSSRLAGEC